MIKNQESSWRTVSLKELPDIFYLLGNSNFSGLSKQKYLQNHFTSVVLLSLYYKSLSFLFHTLEQILDYVKTPIIFLQ